MDKIKLIKELPEGESVISMIVYKDQLILATTKRVYTMTGEGRFKPIEFVTYETAGELNDWVSKSAPVSLHEGNGGKNIDDPQKLRKIIDEVVNGPTEQAWPFPSFEKENL